MERVRIFVFLALIASTFHSLSPAQNVEDLDRLWHQTFNALKANDAVAARDSFAQFNQQLRLYWAKPANLDWKSRYLAGSLYCQFPQSREMGAAMLKALLQDSRDMSDKGKDELRRLLAACTAAPTPTAADTPRDLPADIIDASAHFQTPGVHSFTKGGYTSTGEEVAGVAVSPIPPAELLARRVPLSEPQKALEAAIQRLDGRAKGDVVSPFAVTSTGGDATDARRIGKCLVSYAQPLERQFEIGPPSYMVTAYTTLWADQVYEYARHLHGLNLPGGVVAYSVAEDMSLAGSDCGSMAHELVHLLIKARFPVSPAWLEEGLASEVAVSRPQESTLKFQQSWRDKTLKDNWSLRPPVAKLLELSWTDFTAVSSGDLKRAAAVQAMAAVFIRYLDERDKLSKVYFDVRDHAVGTDLSGFHTYQQIVEDNLGQSVDEVDNDFQRWFKKQFEANSESAGSPMNLPARKASGPCKTISPMQQQSSLDCEPVPPNKKAP